MTRKTVTKTQKAVRRTSKAVKKPEADATHAHPANSALRVHLRKVTDRIKEACVKAAAEKSMTARHIRQYDDICASIDGWFDDIIDGLEAIPKHSSVASFMRALVIYGGASDGAFAVELWKAQARREKAKDLAAIARQEEADDKWRLNAKDIAKDKQRKSKNTLTQEEIVDEIKKALGPNAPGRAEVKRQLSRWQNNGEVPKRGDSVT